MSFIEVCDNTFHLKTKDTSYLFRVGPYRHLEHIYYGRRCQISDAQALSYKKRADFLIELFCQCLTANIL